MGAGERNPPITISDIKIFESYILVGSLILSMVKPFETRPVNPKKSPGFCIICSATATTEALFRVPDAAVIQRYCDKCLPKADYP